MQGIYVRITAQRLRVGIVQFTGLETDLMNDNVRLCQARKGERHEHRNPHHPNRS